MPLFHPGASGKDPNGISVEPVGAGVSLPSGIASVYPSYNRSRVGLAAVRAGTNSMIKMDFGDSTTRGWYAQSASALTAGDVNRAAPMYETAALNAMGIPAICENFFGDGGFGTRVATMDSRLAMGSWLSSASSTAVPTLGGNTLIAGNNTGGPMVWTPNTPCDTYDVWYIQFPTSTGSFQISMTGASPQTLSNINAAKGYVRATITGTLGSALSLTWLAGNCHVAAVVGYNSQIPAVRVMQCGFGGATSATLIASVNGYDPLPALIAFAADAGARSLPMCAKMELGINDVTNGTGASQFATNMALFQSSIAANADVMFSSFFPTAQSVNTLATQRPYVTALKALAATNSALYIGKWEQLGSQEQQAAFGIFNNTKHPQSQLYQLSGQGDARAFLSIAT